MGAQPGNDQPTVRAAEPPALLSAGSQITEHVRLVRELGSGGMGSVWLAEHSALGVPVAVKFLHVSEPLAQRSRLAREARLTAKVDHPHAVKVLEHGETAQGAPFMVMEFIEGDSLATHLARHGRLPLASVRRLVAQLAQVLGAAHAGEILHRDIKPANIMLLSTGGSAPEGLFVKVVDFGIAKSTGGNESRVLTLPGVLIGTPAYMAPEQLIDGRRADLHADLWGLGVVAYEALTGRPAFAGRARAAICAAMLLKRYERVCTIDPQLPPSLDDWFERAFALEAGARFDSAAELAQSFEEAALGGPPDAQPRAPRPVRLHLPDQLFGREREIATVHRAFEQAARGRSRVLFVTGYSGIGKTSLIGAVEQTLTAGGARFVVGKFDQFNRGTPYDSLIQAFRQLIGKSLLDSSPTVDDAAARPLDLAGASGRALIEVIPELEQLIGPQPELDQVSPEEARNRFQVAVGKLIASLATPQHPLVIFLDDLQWADLASIDLITNLATDPESRHVLFVGAYRNNEIDAAHPLTAALERLKAADGALDEISLGPLSEDAVLDLLSAAFPGTSGRVRLAVLCHAKTHGNAFFLRRLLESLCDDGPLRFDHTLRQWTWDLAAIEARAVTDNVVDFVATEIRRMPPPSRKALEAAACIGDAFDLETLAAALGTERAATLEHLRAPLASELIVPAAGRSSLTADREREAARVTFRFAHDRIRQAARSLMDDAAAVRVHREVARFMLDHLEGPERPLRLFELVDHLNAGQSGRPTRLEAAQLRSLNLEAARRASTSAAFEPAYRYMQQALAHLDDHPWASDYEQTLAIHLEGARAAYLSGDHATMERLVAAAVAQGRTVLDRVNAREVKLHSLVAQQRLLDAVQLAVAMLGELGVQLSAAPSREDVERAVVATLGRLKALSADGLSRLPIAHDPTVVAIQRIQNDTMSSAYLAAPNLLPIMGCNIIQMTLESGVCKESPYGFAILGLVLNALNQIDVSYAVGKMAMELLGRIEDRTVHPRTLHVIASFVRPFVEPVREAVENERRVFRLGMDTGDFEYAAWALHTMVCDGLYSGLDLDELETLYQRSRAILEHHQQIAAMGVTLQFGQLLENLTGKAKDPTRLVGPHYDEAAQLVTFKAINYRGAAFVLTVVGTFARFLFRDLRGAREYADAGAEYADGAVATYNQVWFHQYRALAILGAVEATDSAAVAEALKATEANVAQLRTWHRFSAVNHDHRVALVEAELARVQGDPRAAGLYQQAAAAALANRFTHEVAIAHELAYRFHLGQRSRAAAQAHFSAAVTGYERWGASAKAAHLRAEAGAAGLDPPEPLVTPPSASA